MDGSVVVSALRRTSAAAAVFAGSAMVGVLMASARTSRAALAGAMVVFFVAVGASLPRLLIYGTVVWLAVLGLLRRLLSGVTLAGQADPLLVVGAAGLCLLAAAALAQGASRNRSRLGAGILALNLFTLLGALNPLQHSVTAGVTALLFVLVPSLAFWTGRLFCDQAVMRLVLKLLAVLGLAAAIYGLQQTFVGFPSWDARWIRDSGYTALQVGRYVRGFGASSSAAEYASVLAVAIVAWCALGLARGRWPFSMAAVSVLGTALFYASGRAVTVLALFGVCVMFSIWARLSLAKSLVFGVIALSGLSFALGHLGPQGSASNARNELSSHEVGGLGHPFDPRTSTLTGHLTQFREGLVSGVTHPLGQGIAGITIAASKAGTPQNGTEFDPSNAAVALGLPGFLAYLVILIAGFRTAFRVSSGTRDPIALAGFGILTVTLFQWLNGGQYSVAFLPWLFMGWLDAIDQPIGTNPEDSDRTPDPISQIRP